MTRWKSINIRCQECKHVWHDTVDREDEDYEKFECPECGSLSGAKTISAPTVLRASYHDGKKRFQDIREINNLKQERAVTRRENRKEVEKEIRKLGGKIND